MTEPAETSDGREIARDEAQELIADGAQIVDVRAAHEWGAGHIVGATHLPLDELSARVAEIDRERPVILYCRGGNRSSMATAALAEAGFDAAKLTEGIVGWAAAGLPLDPEGGYVAESGEAAAILEARKRAAG
ncbi:MAG: rhodanese-like domain-containing protein [Solirubrobacterales bacterium]